MLVNSGVLGNEQGVDGEEHRDVAAQLQHSSLQIHHHSPQWRRMWCTCVCTVRSMAAIATLGSMTAPHHMAPPDVLTGRTVHARLRREVPVDHEARRQAAMAAAESRSALCSKELRREDAPKAEAGGDFLSSGADQFSGPQGPREPTSG